MLKAKLLKVLRPLYFSKYETSGLVRFTVACKHKPSEDDLAEIGIYGERCDCTYDYCGHMQKYSPRVMRHNKRREWHVTQHFCYNI